nr:hypothetical protein BaRGS_022268 [Batillaria attramentaria]
MPAVKRDGKAPANPGGKRKTYLTTHKVVTAMAALNNERGSTLSSIKKKLENILGLSADTNQVKLALQRAIRSGMINEIVEDRYKVPRQRGARPVAGTSGTQRQRKTGSQASLTAKSSKRLANAAAADRSTRNRRVQKRRPDERRRKRRGNEVSSQSSDADDTRDSEVDAGDGQDRDAGEVVMKDGADRNRDEAVVAPVAGCDAVATFA